MTLVDQAECGHCGHRFRTGQIGTMPGPDPLRRTRQFTLPPLPRRDAPVTYAQAPTPAVAPQTGRHRLCFAGRSRTFRLLPPALPSCRAPLLRRDLAGGALRPCVGRGDDHVRLPNRWGRFAWMARGRRDAASVGTVVAAMASGPGGSAGPDHPATHRPERRLGHDDSASEPAGLALARRSSQGADDAGETDAEGRMRAGIAKDCERCCIIQRPCHEWHG